MATNNPTYKRRIQCRRDKTNAGDRWLVFVMSRDGAIVSKAVYGDAESASGRREAARLIRLARKAVAAYRSATPHSIDTSPPPPLRALAYPIDGSAPGVASISGDEAAAIGLPDSHFDKDLP